MITSFHFVSYRNLHFIHRERANGVAGLRTVRLAPIRAPVYVDVER